MTDRMYDLMTAEIRDIVERWGFTNRTLADVIAKYGDIGFDIMCELGCWNE